MTYSCTIETPLGLMTAAAENDALTGLWFNGQKYFPPAAEKWSCKPDQPIFTELKLHLVRYFRGERQKCDLPLAPHGSDFQKAVWGVLTGIPYGETITYGDIAREIARARAASTMSAQAVGGAVGHNPLTILIPCHRVIGCNGRLTGYAGGLERKEALLRLEGVQMDGR